MQLALIKGYATATVKDPTLKGWRLLLAQPLMADEVGADGFPMLVIDQLGARVGDKVMLTTDGAAVRDMVGSNKTPVRYAVIGIADD